MVRCRVTDVLDVVSGVCTVTRWAASGLFMGIGGAV